MIRTLVLNSGRMRAPIDETDSVVLFVGAY
jgi:hypothetical protein